MTTGAIAVRDETVQVWDGRLRLHVKVAGDGPPLLFFHPLSGLAWQPLLDQLAQQRTVYAPEHPGTSPGDPQAIAEVQTFWELLLIYEEAIRELGLERPVAIGQSFGGMVAADLAASFPRLFSKLVLLAPTGLWRDDAPIPLVEMVAGPPEDLPKYLFAHPESEAARAMMALPSDPAQIPEAIAQGAWNIGCTTKFAWPIADHGLGRRLHRIQVPTLVAWGREDALIPVAYAAEFGSRIAGSQVEVIDDCGHVLQADQPERAWTTISKFLAGLSQPVGQVHDAGQRQQAADGRRLNALAQRPVVHVDAGRQPVIVAGQVVPDDDAPLAVPDVPAARGGHPERASGTPADKREDVHDLAPFDVLPEPPVVERAGRERRPLQQGTGAGHRHDPDLGDGDPGVPGSGVRAVHRQHHGDLAVGYPAEQRAVMRNRHAVVDQLVGDTGDQLSRPDLLVDPITAVP